MIKKEKEKIETNHYQEKANKYFSFELNLNRSYELNKHTQLRTILNGSLQLQVVYKWFSNCFLLRLLEYLIFQNFTKIIGNPKDWISISLKKIKIKNQNKNKSCWIKNERKVTSIDSGLEAFSLYLTDGSLTAMVNQPTVQPNIWINRSSRTESNYYKPTNKS